MAVMVVGFPDWYFWSSTSLQQNPNVISLVVTEPCGLP